MNSLPLAQQNHQRNQVQHGDSEDNYSEMSPLQCGSIPPDPHFDSARDVLHRPFLLPTEIVIRVKIDVPDWLRPAAESHHHSELPQIHRPTTLERGRSAPTESNIPRPTLSPQVSWDFHGEEASVEVDIVWCQQGKTIVPASSPREQSAQSHPTKPLVRSQSNDSRVTLHTSPTDLSTSDEDSLHLGIVSPRRRVDVRLFVRTLPLFRSRRYATTLKRARGCLT